MFLPSNINKNKTIKFSIMMGTLVLFLIYLILLGICIFSLCSFLGVELAMYGTQLVSNM